MKLRVSLLFAMILSVSSKRIKRTSKTGEAGGLRNDQRLTPSFPENFGTRCSSDKDCASDLLVCDKNQNRCRSGDGGSCQLDKDCASGLLLVCDTNRCRSGDAPSFPDNFGTRCSSDKDCASDLLVCDKNQCRSGDGGSCQLDKHCASGLLLVCDENSCISGVGGTCAGDKYCAFGLSCSATDETCEIKDEEEDATETDEDADSEIETEADCSSDEECMVGATTVRVCDHDKSDRCFSGYGGVCTHDKHCASGLVCVGDERHGEKIAFCHWEGDAKYCGTEEDCYEGENLDNMACFWNQCISESDLEFMGLVNNFPENFGMSCKSDGECASDLLVCAGYICKSDLGGTCKGSNHCGLGLSCSVKIEICI